MEPIQILEQRFNLFPAKFSWRGQIISIDAVAECRTELAPSGRSEVYHFLVRANGKFLHLSQRLASGQWWLLPEGAD